MASGYRAQGLRRTYPRMRIDQVSFAMLFMTLGTRLKRLMLGGRFSMIAPAPP